MAISMGAATIAAAAIAAAANTYNGYASSKAAQAAGNDQYIYNMALQKQAQAWQEKMSNTAHQREVQDLKMAGLNPILSANGGATTGSVGTTSVGIDNRAEGIAQAGKGMSEIANVMLQSRANDINKQNADTQEGLADSEKAVNEQKTQLLNNQAKNELIQGEILTIDKAMKQAEKENQPKFIKQNLRKIATEITKNLSDSVRSRAEAKFANERARGFSKTWSEGYSHDENLGIGLHGVNTGNKKSTNTYRSENW